MIAACALSVVGTIINDNHHSTTSLPENGEYDIGIGIGVTSGRVTLAVVPLERLINVFQSLLTGYPLASDSDVFTLRHPPVGFADESGRDARRQVMIGT